ncbi:DUF2058 domain-containing protein [Simiduia agarivorans]|uniref:Nucleoprotein/polynucleotide-associated enzyme n=1 Tax=Simiduia agarivorans (strain DSM 21679 / JCM 13881 / BCRC 17597 / SA1) TaxID=1117647 RepID=K4KPA0_SIMAS|nr:DUF2058 domain-containing protein [Simiduia agarivorans]AFU99943.2 hypothetical protein M5M_14025 [Simiduia agarivorans SA1 = DSM 21679]
MASLQEQLLKAGLADKKKAKEINKQKRKDKQVARRSTDAPVDEIKAAAEAARLQKVEKDRALNAERDALAQEKAIAAQIRQLIVTNRQSKKGGELAYNFTHGKKIKKIYVTEELQKHLIAGRLVIAMLDEQAEIVPRVIGEKIAERNADLVILPAQAAEVQEDDPYADYQIPDDLMW